AMQRAKTYNIHNSIIKLSAIVFGACVTSTTYAVCWDEAASMYGTDPILLKAIGWKESRGHVGAVGSLLKDGNRALGLMQINTIHLPALRKQGITRNDLFDPCTSQKIASWVLADCLKKFGEVWRAVGCYYGGPASKAYTAMNQYSADVRRYFEGYKRKAGLPAVYTPLQPQSIKAQSVNYNEDIPNYSSVNQTIKKTSNFQIIRF
ncbi:lytic transglycosylase domain-containing protein, partial [Acinetobacter baumannii]